MKVVIPCQSFVETGPVSPFVSWVVACCLSVMPFRGEVNFHGVPYCVPKAGLIEMEDCVTNCIISSGFNHYSTCHVFEKVNHVEGDRLLC